MKKPTCPECGGWGLDEYSVSPRPRLCYRCAGTGVWESPPIEPVRADTTAAAKRVSTPGWCVGRSSGCLLPVAFNVGWSHGKFRSHACAVHRDACAATDPGAVIETIYAPGTPAQIRAELGLQEPGEFGRAYGIDPAVLPPMIVTDCSGNPVEVDAPLIVGEHPEPPVVGFARESCEVLNLNPEVVVGVHAYGNVGVCEDGIDLEFRPFVSEIPKPASTGGPVVVMVRGVEHRPYSYNPADAPPPVNPVPMTPDPVLLGVVNDYFDRHIERLVVGQSIIPEGRRRCVLYVPQREILAWVKLVGRPDPEYVTRPVLTGLPADVQLIDVRHDWDRGSFAFVLESASFDPVADGDVLPRYGGPFGVVYETVRIMPREVE